MTVEWINILDHRDISVVMREILADVADDIGKSGWSRVKASGSGVFVETAVARCTHRLLQRETGVSEVHLLYQEVFIMTALLALLEHTAEQPVSTTWDEVRDNIKAWQMMPEVNGFTTLYVIEETRSAHTSWSDTYRHAREIALPLTSADFYPWALE